MTAKGRSPLHKAALTRGETLQQLLDAGADVHARDTEQRTPLHNASLTDPAHVRALLVAGADLEARDSQGRTPLHYAVQRGSWCLEALLEAGADLDAQDANGHTPLHHAMHGNQDWTATRLLAAGANPRRADLTGETPFDMLHPQLGSGLIDDLWLADAQRNGPGRLAQHLESLIDAGIYHRIQMVLEPAQLTGRHSSVRHRGALPLGDWRELADHLSAYCAAHGAWSSLHALHVSGLPVTFPEPMRGRTWSRGELWDVPEGEAPLVLLDAANLWGQGLPLLLELHPTDCRPALEAALFALCGSVLLDPDDRRAEKSRSLGEALRALCYACADLEARNGEVAQRFHAALNLPRTATGEMLWEDDRDFGNRHLPFAGLMLGLVRPVHFTPLLLAAENRSPLVPELLSVGAKADARDRFGRNALHLSVASGTGRDVEANLRALLAAGIAVDEPDANGLRPLARAAAPGIVALLLEKGASPRLDDKERRLLGDAATRKLEIWIRQAQGGAI
jgi:ankyrin repeat protein